MDDLMQGDSWLWTTKAGEEIHIQNMDTAHIINCMRMIEKANFLSSGAVGGGNDSEDFWYEEYEHDYTPVYNNMVLELRFRRLECRRG